MPLCNSSLVAQCLVLTPMSFFLPDAGLTEEAHLKGSDSGPNQLPAGKRQEEMQNWKEEVQIFQCLLILNQLHSQSSGAGTGWNTLAALGECAPSGLKSGDRERER